MVISSNFRFRIAASLLTLVYSSNQHFLLFLLVLSFHRSTQSQQENRSKGLHTGKLNLERRAWKNMNEWVENIQNTKFIFVHSPDNQIPKSRQMPNLLAIEILRNAKKNNGSLNPCHCPPKVVPSQARNKGVYYIAKAKREDVFQTQHQKC